jgi:hypothetical protein
MEGGGVLECFKDGDCVRHAIAKLPGGASQAAARDLADQCSLAIEPGQPAFRCVGGGDSACYRHLLWPKDRSRSVVALCKRRGQIGRPVWSSPMWLVTKGHAAERMPKGMLSHPDLADADVQYGVVTPGRFETTLMVAGLEGWHKILVTHLKGPAHARIFLNSTGRRAVTWRTCVRCSRLRR